jgi:phage minor structural protein
MNDYIYIWDDQQNQVAILSCTLPACCPYWDDIKTERLDHGLLTFEFNIPFDHPTAELIQIEGFVIRENEDNPGEFELFRIKETRTSRNSRSMYVWCENAAVTDLTAQLIETASYPSYTLEQVMGVVLSNTGWQLGKVDYSGVRDFTFENYPTALEALHMVMDQFGAEVKFRVEFDGQRVRGQYIDVLRQRGEDSGQMFIYGYDLTEVERTLNTTDLVTALRAYGKKDNNDKPMTFENYTPPNGIPTGFEKAGDWVGSIEARERYGKDGQHRFAKFEDIDAENPADLFQKTLAKLKELIKPRYTYKVGINLLNKPVALGDNIRIQDKTFQPWLLLEARVIEKKSSKHNPEHNEVTLGEFIPMLPSAPRDLSNIQDYLKNQPPIALGAHVIANGPTFDFESGALFFDPDEYNGILIQVTEPVHLDSTTVFVAEGTNVTVELRDGAGVTLASRQFENLENGENVLKLDFLLSPNNLTQGSYQLVGKFSDLFFAYTNTTEEMYPVTSGSFVVTGSTQDDSYWYGFFNLRVGGANVTGGYGATFRAGNVGNSLGTVEYLDNAGETIFRADADGVEIGTMSAGVIHSDNIVNYSADNHVFYINADTGSDEDYNGLTNETPFASVSHALKLLPKSYDGATTIYIQSDIYEDIDISGFTGLGSITIYGGSRSGTSRPYTYVHHTIIADVYTEGSTVDIRFYYGRWFPRTGVVANDAGTLRAFRTPSLEMYELYLSAKVPGTNQYNYNGLVAYNGTNIQLRSVHFQDWSGGYAVRADLGATVFLYACTGISDTTGTAHALNATRNGMIGIQWGANVYSDLLNIPTPNGGHPVASNGGQTSVATFGGLIQGTPSGVSTTGTSGTSSAPPSNQVITVSYNSLDTAISGRSYRTSVYIGWRDDIDVRQGQWENYGNHVGLWFFGGSLPATPPWVGKTIKEIHLTIKRKTAGGGGSGSMRIYTHNYLTRPAGTPTIGSSYVSASLPGFGQSKTIRLDGNSTIRSAFQNNSAKGLAIANGDYAIFSVEAILKVIYQN